MESPPLIGFVFTWSLVLLLLVGALVLQLTLRGVGQVEVTLKEAMISVVTISLLSTGVALVLQTMLIPSTIDPLSITYLAIAMAMAIALLSTFFTGSGILKRRHNLTWGVAQVIALVFCAIQAVLALSVAVIFFGTGRHHMF